MQRARTLRGVSTLRRALHVPTFERSTCRRFGASQTLRGVQTLRTLFKRFDAGSTSRRFEGRTSLDSPRGAPTSFRSTFRRLDGVSTQKRDSARIKNAKRIKSRRSTHNSLKFARSSQNFRMKNEKTTKNQISSKFRPNFDQISTKFRPNFEKGVFSLYGRASPD